MFWIMGISFGAVMLFYLMRRLVRRQTSLEVYRRKLEKDEARIQREIDHDLRHLPVSETLAPIVSGLREILELHGSGVSCEIVPLREPTRIEARLPSGVLVIQYRLKPVGRERTGSYWEARTPDGKIHVCRSLDALMRLAQQTFDADGCITKILI